MEVDKITGVIVRKYPEHLEVKIIKRGKPVTINIYFDRCDNEIINVVKKFSLIDDIISCQIVLRSILRIPGSDEESESSDVSEEESMTMGNTSNTPIDYDMVGWPLIVSVIIDRKTN